METMAGGGLESLAPSDGGASEAAFESARAGMENLARGAEVAPEQLSDLEAIIIPELRPVYDIKDGSFTTLAFDGRATPGRSLWTKLTSEAALKQRIESALPAIGRIELLWNTNIPYGGTGFLVGRNLLMTNRHVAQIFAEGLGTAMCSSSTAAPPASTQARLGDRTHLRDPQCPDDPSLLGHGSPRSRRPAR
ncbi:hypothetical protein AJ88_04215 [Mesorhizobium amorphae CCBAU 01583]|nr:hypothetical protein AJ88_04215 [Mesorhizobium amorphae CCBAU 01583]